jgi:hypothetical protein
MSAYAPAPLYGLFANLYVHYLLLGVSGTPENTVSVWTFSAFLIY